jgi:hypothetical protein
VAFVHACHQLATENGFRGAEMRRDEISTVVHCHDDGD